MYSTLISGSPPLTTDESRTLYLLAKCTSSCAIFFAKFIKLASRWRPWKARKKSLTFSPPTHTQPAAAFPKLGKIEVCVTGLGGGANHTKNRCRNAFSRESERELETLYFSLSLSLSLSLCCAKSGFDEKIKPWKILKIKGLRLWRLLVGRDEMKFRPQRNAAADVSLVRSLQSFL